MKAALTQNAIPATTQAQNFSDSVFTGDALAMILFGTRATANNTLAAHSANSIGATDKTRAATVSRAEQDNVATMAAASYAISTSRAYSLSGFSGATSLAECDLTGVSHPSDGVQVNWSDIDSQQLVNALLLGGDDIEASVVTASFGVSVNTDTVSHQLSGPPDVLIAFTEDSSGLGDGSSSGAGRMSIGFYVRAGDSYISNGRVSLSSAAAANEAARLSTSHIGFRLTQSTVDTTFTVGNFTSTQFDVTRAGSTGATFIALVCIRGKNSPLLAQLGSFDTPASTGEFDAITGMDGSPQVVLFLPTRLEALDTSDTGDDGGHSGFCAAVKNGSATQQMCAIETSEDGADPSNANCMTSNDRAVRILDIAGSVVFDATVAEWLPDGVRLNATAVPASAKKVAYLAFGMPAPISILARSAVQDTLVRM